ncbi:MAG: hotdog fold domain-containing protein [Candidatus Sericytochromatia bacterium]|nr:hotdog fold domain-containing protein [Candidatus Sericytochromatia bacterium]
MARSAVAQLRAAWQSLHGLPGGRWLFSRVFGLLVPYTGSAGLRIEALRPGYCRASMRDRRGVRNHLSSVHAVALVNLAEATSGLAMNIALPDSARAIVTHIAIAYHKKARGTLVAECEAGVPAVEAEQDLAVTASIKDAAGDVVAVATVTWRVGPRLPSGGG